MVELILTPRVYSEEDHAAAKAEKIVLNRKHFSELLVDEGIGSTGFCGLVNEGQTCYVNSLLQTLFILKKFRQRIFSI